MNTSRNKNTSRDEHGDLIIPPIGQDLTIEDNCFGLLFNVTEPTYLYTKPPTEAIEGLVDAVGSKSSKVDPPHDYPVFVFDEDDRPLIGIQQELTANQEVMAKDVPGYPGVKEVVVFTRSGAKRQDMPETGRGVRIEQRGYVLEKHLRKHQNKEDFTEANEKPIFPNDDLIGDIHQSIFGDCFLLASLLTILKKPGGEDFIRGMMKQEGSSVVVRLFDPNAKKFIFIRVENSEYAENDKTTVRHKAPWVHILEKAYAALALKEEGKQYLYSDLSFRAMFGEGGEPHVAMQILTGQEAEFKWTERNTHFPWDSRNILYSWGLYHRTYPLIESLGCKRLEECADKLDALQQEINEIYENDGEDFLKNLKDEILVYKGAELEDQKEIFDAIIENLKKERDDQRHDENRRAFIQKLIDYLNSVPEEKKLPSLPKAWSDFINESLNDKSELPIFDVLKTISSVARVGEYMQDLMINDPEKWQDLRKDLGIADEDEDDEKSEDDEEDKKVFEAVEQDKILAKYNTFQRNFPGLLDEKKFEEYIAKHQEEWSGPVNTGVYDDKALNTYNDIKEKIEENYLLVGTCVFTGRVKGLRPNHAYAITGVVEEKLETGVKGKEKEKEKEREEELGDEKKDADKERTRLYIIVRNPWGRVGQKHNPGQEYAIRDAEIQEDEGAAEFKVELSQFVECFERYTFSKEPFTSYEKVLERRDDKNVVPNIAEGDQPENNGGNNGGDEVVAVRLPAPVLEAAVEEETLGFWDGFWVRNAGEVLVSTAAGAIAGAAVGATLGILGIVPAAVFGFGVGGVAVAAATPVIALGGAVVVGALGFVAGVVGCLAIDTVKWLMDDLPRVKVPKKTKEPVVQNSDNDRDQGRGHKNTSTGWLGKIFGWNNGEQRVRDPRPQGKQRLPDPPQLTRSYSALLVGRGKNQTESGQDHPKPRHKRNNSTSF